MDGRCYTYSVDARWSHTRCILHEDLLRPDEMMLGRQIKIIILLLILKKLLLTVKISFFFFFFYFFAEIRFG